MLNSPFSFSLLLPESFDFYVASVPVDAPSTQNWTAVEMLLGYRFLAFIVSNSLHFSRQYTDATFARLETEREGNVSSILWADADR